MSRSIEAKEVRLFVMAGKHGHALAVIIIKALPSILVAGAVAYGVACGRLALPASLYPALGVGALACGAGGVAMGGIARFKGRS